MTKRVIPAGLGTGGRDLWRQITTAHELDAAQKVQLLEACRAKDRLDKLDAVLTGDAETWMRLVFDEASEEYSIRIHGALNAANATANLLKQLLAAMRLPDTDTGKRPQQRPARGAYKGSGGAVSSLDRARAAKSG